MSLFPKKVE